MRGPGSQNIDVRNNRRRHRFRGMLPHPLTGFKAITFVWGMFVHLRQMCTGGSLSSLACHAASCPAHVTGVCTFAQSLGRAVARRCSKAECQVRRRVDAEEDSGTRLSFLSGQHCHKVEGLALSALFLCSSSLPCCGLPSPVAFRGGGIHVRCRGVSVSGGDCLHRRAG